MKTRLSRVLTALLVCTLCAPLLGMPPSAGADGYTQSPTATMVRKSYMSDWMSSAEYQSYFDQHMQRVFPAYVEGRCIAGRCEYRAYFIPWDRSFSWETHHGLLWEQYSADNERLLAQGYTRVSFQSFTDNEGITRYQATWIK